MTFKEFLAGFRKFRVTDEFVARTIVWQHNWVGGFMTFVLTRWEKPLLFVYYDGQTMWRGWTWWGFKRWMKKQNGYIVLDKQPKPYFDFQ